MPDSSQAYFLHGPTHPMFLCRTKVLRSEHTREILSLAPAFSLIYLAGRSYLRKIMSRCDGYRVPSEPQSQRHNEYRGVGRQPESKVLVLRLQTIGARDYQTLLGTMGIQAESNAELREITLKRRPARRKVHTATALRPRGDTTLIMGSGMYAI